MAYDTLDGQSRIKPSSGASILQREEQAMKEHDILYGLLVKQVWDQAAEAHSAEYPVAHINV
jgi:hypothetical protein